MFQKIKATFQAIKLLIKYRKYVIAVIRDLDDIFNGVRDLLEAKTLGVAASNRAREILLNLCSLNSVVSFVQATETQSDDEGLAKIRAVLENDTVFAIAWRLICGDTTSPDSTRFSDRIKKIKDLINRQNQLEDFGDPDKCLMATGITSATDDEKAGVSSILTIVMILISIFRYLIIFREYFKNRNRQDKETVDVNDI